MFHALSPGYWLTLHGLVTIAAVLCYVLTSHAMQQRRQPAAAIAWIFFILLLPYVALPAYLAFGSRKRKRPHQGERLAQAGGGSWASETIRALEQPAPAGYRDLSVHDDGVAARDALFATIDAARHSIDLCTFIFGRDALGTAVLDRLVRKARAGVRVRVLLDGLGRLMGGQPGLAAFKTAGGEFSVFVPPLFSPLKGRTNLRNHRKLVIADAGTEGGRLWCGGRNLATEYFGGTERTPAWHDLTFDVRGPLVEQAWALFEHDWNFSTGRGPQTPWPPSTTAAVEPEQGAQVIASGPDQMDDTVYALLVTAAYRARRRIALITPYFVPDAALLMALSLAARRGVAVDLLLPARSNHLLSDFARNRALRALALAGGRIWLAPGMLHAKLAVIDDVVALAGSANLDSRSLFLNYEMMIAFQRAPDVQRFAAWFERSRASAHAYVARPPGLVRDIAEGMLLWVGFQL